MSTERISIGIPKLDELIGGGIPRRFFVAITGEPGTGKTILCMHFIWAGLQNKEPGIYVTTEESRDSIIRQAEAFGWNFLNAVSSEDLIIVDALMRKKSDAWSLSKLTVKELVNVIIRAKKRIGYGHVRVVIDSMSAFWLDKPAMARRFSYYVKRALSPWNMTVLATSQYAITTSDAFGFGIEHVADGVIRFRRSVRDGVLRRFLIIEKMRQTNHNRQVWEIDIVEGRGLEILRPITTLSREDFSLPEEVTQKILEARRKKEEALGPTDEETDY
ncbi:MAG: KaiC domain-containing protein [Crenarchaeota archaeon]|nr:KaiC domain-containing protein [Thermoproteota archaeon]MCR8454142.1 KaiC domain-containing protein [Thermoproteota archaeon]MCR8455522.1 KaiC domain-containing protein [Thermoproteota archaeon]MCR8463209.1 KaiC domain-containing protein [Thermoproteota archaeon]MCR8470860.1 KaiC domain-containing protein [Thermoproteota archaeon]